MAAASTTIASHDPFYEEHEEENSDLTASILAVGKALNEAATTSQHDDDDDDREHESSSVHERRTSLEEPLLRRRNNIPPWNDDAREQSSPRILDRDGAFHQSRGKWSVERRSRGVRIYQGLPTTTRNAGFFRNRYCQGAVSRLWLGPDWFHNLAYKPTLVLMTILFLIYALIVFFFAFVYLGVSKLFAPRNGDDGSIHHSFCGMDINNHMEALYFSLSTMTTIGYGVSDYYFGDCWTPLLLVLWQSCAAITFSAVAIGLLFQRISRGQKRTKTILFSDKAVVRRVRGVPYLMFRVGELRRHHLIEASVRAYCLRHERLPLNTELIYENGESREERSVEIETTHYLTRHMELLHPDEAVGSHILMSLPQVIVHRLDARSPLVPPRPVWYDANGYAHGSRHGETDSWFDYDNLQQFLRDRDSEVIVLLEGTDELTGSAIQARHSYRADDIAWDCKFAPCVFPSTFAPRQEEEQSRWSWLRSRTCDTRPRKPACIVDFQRFHDILSAASDCDACALVPQ